jgi:hypothetical protein
VSPLAASPGTGTSYELGQRLRLRIPSLIRKSDFINTDFKTMDVTVLCNSVRNPNVTASSGLVQFTMYSEAFKTACEGVEESVFSGCVSAGGSVAPLVPAKTVLLPAIHAERWGIIDLSLFAAANNTAGSDYSTVTLQIQPHILPISTRGVIDFRLPSSWLVQPVPVGHHRAGIICVASVDIGSSADADIPGITVMDSVKRRITFYPKKYVRASPNGVFRLFCEGVRVPTSAKTATTITPRVYETIIPFSWVPAPGHTQNDYVFPTRSLYLKNANVSLPRITNTLAPSSVLVHTIQLESRRILPQDKLTDMLDVYSRVMSTAIRTGRLSPTNEPNALAMVPASASTGVGVSATPRILFRLKMYRNVLHYAKVYTDDFGNFEYDITLKVKILLEGLSGTNAYQLSNILLAMDNELVTAISDTLNLFVIARETPQVITLPGSCASTAYTNDGNVADAGCGRGCANCAVGYSCFDDTDCLSGLCSSGVPGNTTFVPILDEEQLARRGGFRGTCLESVMTEDTSGSRSMMANAAAISLTILILVLIL